MPSFLVALHVAAAVVLSAGNSSSGRESKLLRYDAFHPGDLWLDTDGNRIRAHQPHIFGPLDGIYYWYGASKVGSSDGIAGAINVYTSKDLYNWEYRGAAYNQSKYAARPSMLGRNPHSGKFVLWAKGGKSFQSAVSDSPLGPFVQAGAYDPTANSTAGDSASFLDPSTGEAYYVYSQHLPSRAMRVLKLNSQWIGLSGEAPMDTVSGHLEAPVAFHSSVTKKSYIWTSHTSGWKPNAAELLTADSMLGPWSQLGNPSGNKLTFGTQGSHILPLGVVDGTQRFLYMGDRYEPFIDTKEGSRYIMLPLEVHKDGSIRLYNESTWSIDNWPGADEVLV